MEWRPKILSSGMQIGHMCQLTCPWSPSLGKCISCSFLHWFEWFLLYKMLRMKGYKKFLGSKTNREMWVQTWTTPACLFLWLFFEKYSLDIFGILLKNSSKNSFNFFIKISYNFIEVYVKKFGKKCHFQTNSNPFTSPFTF